MSDLEDSSQGTLARKLGANLHDRKGLDVLAQEDNVREQAKKTHELFQSIYDELDERDSDIKDGLSYLDLKNDTLLSYMIDVCNIMLRKLNRKSIEGHQSVERCVEYRLILEKIKSIDQKISYQLNKLITMPENAPEEGRVDIKNLDIDVGSESDNSDEHENPAANDENDDEDADTEASGSEVGEGDDLSVSSGDEDMQEEEEDKVLPKKGKIPKKLQNKPKQPVGVYKPPKLRSVAYEEKDRYRVHGDFYRDDDDDEFVEPTTIGGRLNADKDRQEFEEDNYTRLRDENPKRAKRKMKTKEYRRKGRKRRK